MNGQQFITVSDYLKKSYEDGFIGTLYDLHGQGVPLIFPINQKQVVNALVSNTKLSKPLYESLGYHINELKKSVNSELSRGIASGLSYSDIARNINKRTGVSLNKSYRIARTEGHRIQNEAAEDARTTAKSKGADIVKQWDATLDGRTRHSHRVVDGEIRDLKEKFSNGLLYPGDYNGAAAEVINCRCACLQRAKLALDEDELNILKQRAAYYGLDKTDNFEDFKKKYLSAVDNSESDIYNGKRVINIGRSVGASAKNYPVKLLNSKQHVKLAEGQTLIGKVFAGKGTDIQIRDRFRLSEKYKISEDEWKKVSGNGYIIVDGKKIEAELHWYEANDEVFEMKVKRYLDEN